MPCPGCRNVAEVANLTDVGALAASRVRIRCSVEPYDEIFHSGWLNIAGGNMSLRLAHEPLAYNNRDTYHDDRG